MSGQAAAPGVDWYASAACGGANSRTFFKATPSEAKKICGGCPVRAECLHHAVETRVPDGIWGGLTYKERRSLPELPTRRTEALVVLRGILADQYSQKPEPPAPKEVPPTPTPVASPTPAESQATPVGAQREDVAELLRQGVPSRQIMQQLQVSSRVVAATRKAYGIPYVKGAGFRFTPQERERTVEMLRAGASYAEITAEVGISGPSALRIRRQMGIEPSGNTGAQTPRTVAEALADSVRPYGDGHARWTGSMAGRMPQLYAERRRFNGRHVVFERHHGRPPVGRVRTTCGVTDCIAGSHLSDQTLRRTQPAEEPVTVQALKNLLTEIDEQGGPQAARDNRLHLTQPTSPTSEETDTMPTTDAEPMPSGRGLTPAQADAETLKVSVLLQWGNEHPDPDVQDQAVRTGALLAGLRMRYAADKEFTALSDEASQLEKRLAELRARQAELAPAKPKKRTVSYRAAEVRAWAKENTIACPAVGRVPKAVLDAWRSATGAQDGQP